ncbi:MAG TPA: DnaJ domain-containing protein [Verrucomicrobiae bacterium]|nr:DnaJ domain-containing protein [Verrucomicrobiae bacterium]
MTDAFALLRLPRRPWLEAGELQARFHQLSAELHPDRLRHLPDAERVAAESRYSALNTAYQLLRDPKQRLGHLLELELGARPAEMREIPPALSDFFFALGPVLREVDAFLARRDAESSPLLRVQWFERGMEWDDKLRESQARVQEMHTALETELRGLGDAWPAHTNTATPSVEGTLPRLGEIYRALSLLGRWQSQLQERLMKLVA